MALHRGNHPFGESEGIAAVLPGDEGTGPIHDSAPEVGELRRYDRSRRREERATLRISPHTAGFAQDGSVGYQVTPKSEAGCELLSVCPSPYDIHRIDAVRFEPADRLQLR